MSEARPSTETPDRPAFGHYRLPAWAERLCGLCQRLEGAKRLAFLLRKPVLALRRPLIDITVQGMKLRLAPGQNLSDKRLLTTPWMLDGAERALLAAELEPDGWLVDIGANVGGFSLLLAAARPDVRILCVEPDPELAERLATHIAFNQLEGRVSLARAAVTETPGEVRLYRDESNRGRNSLLAAHVADPADAVSVPGKPLLALLDEFGIGRPGALKLDIEGFELPVLRGFLNSAPRERWPRFIQLEQPGRTGVSEAAETALALGYRARLRTRMNVVLERATEG